MDEIKDKVISNMDDAEIFEAARKLKELLDSAILRSEIVGEADTRKLLWDLRANLLVVLR
nr:MAG TPA: RPAP1-like protein [Caudoviricetes sp.]